MKRGTGNIEGIAASALLCLLTVGVFWVLQDYGPESALRKFHRAAVNRNIRELADLVTPNTYRVNLEELAGMVDWYARNGARYQLGHVVRGNKHVEAEVVYIFPNRLMQRPVIWVVDKIPGGWRVNVNATVAMMRNP